MEDNNYILSDDSYNEEAYYSDQIDSDIEAELYGLIHHDAQDNSNSLQNNSDSVENKSSCTENNSVLLQNSLGPINDNSVTIEDSINSTKKQKNSPKKNIKNCCTLVKTKSDIFCSDTIASNNLYCSFESPVKEQKTQSNQVQSESSERNVTDKPAKRKSDVVSGILENIQVKKNMKSKLKQSENSVSKLKNKKCDHNSTINLADSFVEVLDDSSDSDSDSSIIFVEPDQTDLQTNITKETVVLSSDSGDSDSSREESFFRACQRQQATIALGNADVSSNNKDPWHINSEDRFRTKKQSNRYHENAVITCSNCQLKGHSAKFCSVPKAMKCFFCGDYHSGMNCRKKICTKCFHQGHDRTRCYIRFVDTCELCRMRGHSEKNCPDLWRRYHLTTKVSKGSIVKGNPNPHSRLYCYNCGAKGHYGAECMENRSDRWSFPTWTSVISYKNPTCVFQKERERNFHDRSNFNRTSETSRLDKTPETSRFNRTAETSRYDRTPLFHRRKGNKAFSKETPNQNTKRKKKKKSKTPPNTNNQSIPNINHAVQNDVYFPRTPKMIPSRTTERIFRKKLKNKESHIIRQQVMHRIGLQQRLGLPFPSTI